MQLLASLSVTAASASSAVAKPSQAESGLQTDRPTSAGVGPVYLERNANDSSPGPNLALLALLRPGSGLRTAFPGASAVHPLVNALVRTYALGTNV